VSGPVGQYSTFAVDGLHFGVAALRVQEFLRYQRMTQVPLAPGDVAGLINLRGQIVTAIDLRTRLGLPPRPDGRLPMNVVLRSDTGPVSLLVDEIGDVLDVADDTFEPPPATVGRPARDLILGAHKLPGRLLLVLDTDRAIAVPATR